MNFSIFKSKSTNAQVSYNLISTMVRTGVGFLTMPIFTRLLGVEQYGNYSIYLSWYNIIICFISLGCGDGLANALYKYKDNYNSFRSSVLFGGTLMCLITTLTGLILYKPLSGFFRYPFIIFIIMFLEATAAYVINFTNNAWIYEKKASWNMVLSLVVLFSTTFLSLFLLWRWPLGQESLYAARVIGVAFPNILIAVVVWGLIFKSKPTYYNKEYWLFSFAFGIPTIFHTLSHQVLSSSDRLMMQNLGVSITDIGVYSFFYTFVYILNTILLALNNSWVPFWYEDLSNKEYPKLKARVYNYIQVFTVLSCGFLLLSREMAKLFANEQYWSGMPLIPIIVVVVYLTFIYQFPVNYEFFKAKPRIIAYGTASAAVENIVLNAFLIPRFGMYGAAIATLISYATLAGIHWCVVKKWKEEKYPFSIIPLIKGMLMVLVNCVLYYALADYWFFRWIIAVGMGLYLVMQIYKRKTIF